MNSDTEFARGETPFDPDDHTVVAAFADKDTAQRAVKALNEEGFHKTWIGVTKADFEIDEANDSGIITTKVEDDSIAGKIGRFFSGGKGGTSLYKALQRHGVSEFEASRIDAALEPNDVILTVHGSNHPELAAQLIEDLNGDILSGGYEDADIYARDMRLEEGGRSRLRDERLQSGIVPTYSEELFVVYDDDADIDPERAEDTRSPGASVGTTQRHEA
jgi:hypothetical protein